MATRIIRRKQWNENYYKRKTVDFFSIVFIRSIIIIIARIRDCLEKNARWKSRAAIFIRIIADAGSVETFSSSRRARERNHLTRTFVGRSSFRDFFRISGERSAPSHRRGTSRHQFPQSFSPSFILVLEKVVEKKKETPPLLTRRFPPMRATSSLFCIDKKESSARLLNYFPSDSPLIVA